jgi:hypothetical protein
MKYELSDGDSGEDSDGKRRGKNAKARAAAAQPRKKEMVDMENIYSDDPNRLDMIANLTSSRLLEISERFDMYPSAT